MKFGIIKDFVEGLWKPTTDLIDNLHTSDEERLNLKAGFLQIQAATLQHVLEYESANLAARASIIEAEAKSRWAITSLWRPITMLTFLLLVVAHWFGLTPETMPQEDVDSVFLLIQIGLGGYVVGRSGEKIAETVVNRNAEVK